MTDGEGLIHSEAGRLLLLAAWSFLCLLVTALSIAAREFIVNLWRAIARTDQGLPPRQSPWWQWALGLLVFWCWGPALLAARWYATPRVVAVLAVAEQFRWVPLLLVGAAAVGLGAWLLWRRPEPEQPEPMYVMPPAPVQMWGLAEHERIGGLG